MKRTIVLHSETDAERFGAWLMKSAPSVVGLQVDLGPQTRTLDQNARFHALVGDISKQLVWKGAHHPAEWWKRTLCLQWLIEKRQDPEAIASLDGREFGVLIPHTSTLNVKQMAELIEMTTAFGAENGVQFKEPGP